MITHTALGQRGPVSGQIPAPFAVTRNLSLPALSISPEPENAVALRYEHIVARGAPSGGYEPYAQAATVSLRYSYHDREASMSLPVIARIDGKSAPEAGTDIGSLALGAKIRLGAWAGEDWEVHLAPALRLTLPTRGVLVGEPVYWGGEPILAFAVRDADLSLILNQGLLFTLDTDAPSASEQHLDWTSSYTLSVQFGKLAGQVSLDSVVRLTEGATKRKPALAYLTPALIWSPSQRMRVAAGAQVSMPGDARDRLAWTGAVSLDYRFGHR